MAEQKRKILLVDDDSFLLDMYSTKLRETGFGVDIAQSGTEAMEKMRSGSPFDVVLLDIIMTGMDGFAVLENMKKEGFLEKTKVIVLSNLGQKEDVEKAMSLGAKDYIIKAYFTPSEIVKKIEKLFS